MTAILVADDMEEVRFAYEAILTAAGYEVTTVSGGDEACALMDQEAFDLVLTDLMMTKGDGFLLASHAHRMTKRPKLLVVTGGSERISAFEALQMGEYLFDGSMIKPVKRDELLTTVKKLLQIH